MFPWNLQSLGNAKWEFHPVLYGPGLQFHSQVWVTLTWHSLGCGDALSVGSQMRNVPFFFPWDLPGEGWSHWDIVISWCQSLRRVFKRNPPHPCVHPLVSCWCLVPNIQNLAGKGPIANHITQRQLSAASRRFYPNKYLWNPICFFSSPATNEVFFLQGDFFALWCDIVTERTLTGGILILFVRIHSISGFFTLTPRSIGIYFNFFFFLFPMLIKRIVLLMLCHRRTLWNESCCSSRCQACK